MALPIARVSANDKNAVSATTSVAAAYTTALTANNSIIAIVAANVAAGVVSVDNTFQLLTERAQGSLVVSVWGRAVGAASGTTPTITASAAGASIMQLHLYEFSGVKTGFGLVSMDGTPGSNNGTTVTTLNTGSITTPFADDLVLVAVAQSGGTNGGSTSWVTATNLQANATNRLIVGQYLPAAELTAFSDTASWTTARTSVAIILALQPEQTAASSTDTGTGTDAGESVAGAISDTESGAGTDAGEAVAATVSNDDPGAATDAGESVAAAVSNTETGTGSDAGEAVAAATSDTEAATATDAGETLAVALTENDTATATDGNELIAVAGSDSDSGTATDAASAAASLTEAEAAVVAEAESIIVHLSDSDTGSAADAGSVAATNVGGWLVGASYL